MLLEGGFGSFEKESVYAFIQVLACHIVVNYSEAWDVNCAAISASFHIVGDFCELALLLDDLDRSLSRTTL